MVFEEITSKLNEEIKKVEEENNEMKTKEIEDIIEDCVIIKMKDIPEHMVGIDLTWLDKEIKKIKDKLTSLLNRKMK